MSRAVYLKLNKFKIRELQRRKGWSQKELVERMGISRAYLWDCTSGRANVGKKIIDGLLKVGVSRRELPQYLIIDEPERIER